MSDSDKMLNQFQAIQTLRAELRGVTEALETLIEDGFPMRPMSGDRSGVDDWEKWHLAMEKRIADARKALALSEKFEDPP